MQMYTLIFALSSIVQILANKSILILRHGARDPDVWTEYDKLYLWTDPINILTQKGVDQLIAVGKQQQKQDIFDKNGHCIYEKIELQSSKTARCTSSTVCFIKGLCPLNYADILHRFFQEYYAGRVLDQKKFAKILSSDFSNPLSLDYDIFDKSGDFMFLGHKTDQCPNLKKINKEIQSSKIYKDNEKSFLQNKELDEIYKIFVQAYPSKKIDKNTLTLTDIDDIYDDTFCNQFQGYHFPNPEVTTYKYMEDVVKFLKYYGKNSQLYQHQTSLSEPFKWIISQLYSDQPISVYVGTESNQFAMLSVIIDEQYLTQFASELEFIINGNLVQVYFNKKLLKTKLCSEGYNCTKEQIVLYFNQYIVEDVAKLCGASFTQ